MKKNIGGFGLWADFGPRPQFGGVAACSASQPKVRRASARRLAALGAR
jgi:hypothetical protein